MRHPSRGGEGMDGTVRLNRQAVRKVVERHSRLMTEAQERGENSQQVGLDNLDAIQERIANQPLELQNAFWVMFTEELEAITSHINHQTEKLNQETERLLEKQAEFESKADYAGTMIGAVILLLFFVMILSM